MFRWWLRYSRLWLIATEARLTLRLNTWAARTLHLFFVGLFLFVGGLFCSASLLLWLSRPLGWVSALLLVGGLWVSAALLLAWRGPRWLHRYFAQREALYRLRLAQAGMQLIQKRLAQEPPPLAFPPWLAPVFSWLWRSLRKSIFRKLRTWLRL